MVKKFLENSRVVENKKLATCVWKLVLFAPKTADVISAGQFVHMQVDGGAKSMLRRPFSVFNARKNEGVIEIIYEIKGEGTKLMKSWQAGVSVSLISPLGNSWLSTLQCEEQTSASYSEFGRALLVGGGVGAAPLYVLAKMLCEAGVNVDVVIGARTKELLVLERDYEALAIANLVCATDDSTYGEGGFCTIPATKMIDKNGYDYVATCGPVPVMSAVSKAAEHKVKCVEVSMEERMACGVGACKTCVVDTIYGKVKACDNGPIFSSKVIKW